VKRINGIINFLTQYEQKNIAENGTFIIKSIQTGHNFYELPMHDNNKGQKISFYHIWTLSNVITSSACQTNGPCGIQEDVCLPAEEHELVAHLALH